MAIKLEGRLKAVADNVPECATVADIGTDHAFIPIYLVSQGICKRAIATDLRKGPLCVAQRNISEYGLTEVIETRIGCGLRPIADHEAETLIIAGMGGLLIAEILGDGMDKVMGFKSIIIQPMYAAEYLREWLQLNGFEIYDEDLAEEGSKLYNIIDARLSTVTLKTPDTDNVIGKALIAKKHPLLKKYIQKQIKIYTKIVEGLCKARNSAAESGNELEKTEKILRYLQGLITTI
jgi:tRNA (adenine22-N1)-methyltransferase